MIAGDTSTKAPGAPLEAGGRWQGALRWAGFILFGLAGLAMLIHTTPIMQDGFTVMARGFAGQQDIPVAVVAIVFMLWLRSRRGAADQGGTLALSDWQAVALLVGLAALLWALRVWVLYDYDLSRDEKMVPFDAAIYARGQLFAPIPPFWRDWYEPLNINFILPVGDRAGWVSSYLPINAALRALAGLVLPASLISPLLVLAGGLALWRIAKTLFADSAATQAVVLLLYVGSSQVAITGTSAYAMTAHLAANLVWLWLFLKRRALADAGAIALGFFAIGIHQPLFHPLFVAPFLLMLLREQAWRRLAAYVVCYGAFGLFWLAWPGWISALGGPVPSDINAEGISFVERFLRSVPHVSDVSFTVMGANLLRFFAWQHVLLLPLAIIAMRSDARADPVFRALWQGIVLLVVVMTVLLPMQGHGWGYRYLHGFIGSAALIAGYGWRWLERQGAAPVVAMQLGTALSLVVLLPEHVWIANRIIAPFAEANAAIGRIPADVVVVDTERASFSTDLVYNRADLSNRPIRLDNRDVLADDLPDLCEGRTLGFADTPMFAAIDRYFGVKPAGEASPRQRLLQAAAQKAGCRIVPSPK